MTDENGVTLDEDEGVIELEDDEGNVSRFEFIDRLEYNGDVYFALVPADYDEDEGAEEFVVLKQTVINGEEMLCTVDDDDEYNSVGEMFLERFAKLPEFEFDDGDSEE